jgi:hypothetical protein
LYACGGSGDVSVGNPQDGGGDGAASSSGGNGDGGGTGKDGSSGHDGSTSSSGGGSDGGGLDGTVNDAGSSSGEAGSSGGEGGVTEGGGSEGGDDGGGLEAGGDGGGGEAGSEAGAGDGGDGGSGSGDAGDGGAGGDASDAGGGPDGSSPVAHFRAGELMPNPGANDFCWQSAGGAWNGPVMSGFGIAARLAYEEVTEYLPVPVAQTTVRFVASNATDCTTSVADVSFTPATADDAYFVSLFAVGQATPHATAFLDERGTNGITGTLLRFVDASVLGGTGAPTTSAQDLYLPAAVNPTVLFSDVPFGGIAPTGNGVDANGYLAHDAMTNADLRVREHTGFLDLLDAAGTSTTGGHVYSLFTVGVHNVLGTNKSPMQLLVCDDTAAPTNHLMACAAGGTQL